MIPIKNIKKSIAAFIMAFIIVFIPVFVMADDTSDVSDVSKNPVSSEPSASDTEPVITSDNAIVVMSAENGQILMNTANGREVDPTCSAKLMTAMIVFDTVKNLDAQVTIDAKALQGIGNIGDISAPRLGLHAGETYTVRQLLQATLISAANDACNALAYYCSDGDIAAFVSQMNARAAELGCTHTYYTNTTGLYDGEAYTTVEDVAVVAVEFYRHNTLLDLSSQPSYVIGGSTVHTKNYLRSETLLRGCMIPLAKGMIAGQRTAQADYCLITSAETGGIGYVYVIMEAPGEIRNPDGTRGFPEENAYSDMKKIFDWYRNAYGYVSLVKKGEVVGEIPVDIAAESVDHVNYVVEETVERLVLKSMDPDDIKFVKKLTVERLSAPVKKNTNVGTMEIYYNDELLATVNLITNNDVERSELLSVFDTFKSFLFGSTMKTVTKVIIGIIIAFVLFTVGAKIYYVIKKAKRELEKRDADKIRRNIEQKHNSAPVNRIGKPNKPSDGSDNRN